MPKQKKSKSTSEVTTKTKKTNTKANKRVEPQLPPGVVNVLMTQSEVDGLVDLLRISAIVYDSSRQMAEQQADIQAASASAGRAELARHFLTKFQAVADIGEPDSRYNH